MDQTATNLPPQEAISTDAIVWQVLGDLRAVVGSASYFAPMARAAETLRNEALASNRRELVPAQKARLVAALRDALNAIYPAMREGIEQNELLMSMNALGTLVLSWAGDSRWPPNGDKILDARDFAMAFEHQMRRLVVLDAMLERHRPLAANVASEGAAP